METIVKNKCFRVLKKIKGSFFELLENNLSYDTYKSIKIWYEHITTKDRQHLYRTAYFYKKKKKAKEKYCIIRMQAPDFMTFAAAIQYIFIYEWAKSKGYIPVMDLELGYDFEKFGFGKDNIWEYTFEQPIGVEEVLMKEWVLVESIGVGDKWLPQTCLAINGTGKDHFLHAVQDDWRDYYRKVHQYIEPIWTFKKEILEEYREKYSGEIERNNVLGVVLREEFSEKAQQMRTSDKAKECYNRHPISPDLEETIEIVKEYMEKWKCQKIFLSTIYEESVILFQKQFGKNNVLFVERTRESFNRIKESDDWIEMDEKELYHYCKNSYFLFEKVVKYADEILAISNCQYFIGAKCSGTSAALAINGGKYKDIYILPDANNIKRY